MARQIENHVHTYDEDGNITCCVVDELAQAKVVKEESKDNDDQGHSHMHGSGLKMYLPAFISFILLISGLALENILHFNFFSGWIKIIWYTAAYLPVALPVIKEGWATLRRGEVFTEFTLMSIATIGAFAIGEYPEGVAVMLFYTVGELFQGAAVKKAKNNIKALLDVRPNSAHVYRNGTFQKVDAKQVGIGEVIQVKVGERVPLDGSLLSEDASLNTAALTGESVPQKKLQNEKVLAGSINLRKLIELKVEKSFDKSSIARILELVENATARKSKTELLIRRLAKIYTPFVVYLALAICFLPYFFTDNYLFSDWLYRALIFLVISCPCALVISIPLGYFGGLGAASKNGLLFKGATYLDQLTRVNTLVMDKTGTLTKGVFKIKDIDVRNGWSENEFMQLVKSVESKSNHPIAKAIMDYKLKGSLLEVSDLVEFPGKGIEAIVQERPILLGNKKLMDQFDIEIPLETNSVVETLVLVAIDHQFAGFISISDELKPDSKSTITQLRKAGIKQIHLLSGDKESITKKIATELEIDSAKGNLLPEDKLNELEQLKRLTETRVAFVGDGINDAPVLAASDVGIAMGAMGSDVAIETADIVIQTDQPSKIVTGIQIAKSTQNIIWQNISLAFGVKFIVLILGAVGMATMWAAVFADVGVALLAILNAVRLQQMSWS